MNFKHITFVVENLQQTIDFYETVAELKVERRYTEGEAELAFLTDGKGGTEIELVCMKDMQKFEGKGFFLCFATDKLDKMHVVAKDKGYNPSDIRNPNPTARYFYVYDPNGVSVQLREYL